jgi:hypothetical protein
MGDYRRRIATLFAVTASIFVVSMAAALILGRPGVALALGAAGGVLIGLARLAKVLMTDDTRLSHDPDSHAEQNKDPIDQAGSST